MVSRSEERKRQAVERDQRRVRVLQLWRSGQTQRAIADYLKVSPATVNSDIKAVFDELRESRLHDADYVRAMIVEVCRSAISAHTPGMLAGRPEDTYACLKAADTMGKYTVGPQAPRLPVQPDDDDLVALPAPRDALALDLSRLSDAQLLAYEEMVATAGPTIEGEYEVVE